MRRALVLTDEGARHPFRASLPPHVRDEKRRVDISVLGLTPDDVKGAASVYFAVFAAVFAFII